MDFKDNDGTTKMSMDTDYFISSAWPAWPDESAPSKLDLIAEMRRLKEEVLALRVELDALTSTP